MIVGACEVFDVDRGRRQCWGTCAHMPVGVTSKFSDLLSSSHTVSGLPTGLGDGGREPGRPVPGAGGDDGARHSRPHLQGRRRLQSPDPAGQGALADMPSSCWLVPLLRLD